MLQVKAKIKNLDYLKQVIETISLLQEYKDNKKFQKYIQNKCLEVIQNKINELLPYTGDTVEQYKTNNKIEEFDEGFIIYNDTYVETETVGYDGKFSIALAFEYGTGIVGQENPKQNAWQYNVNQYEKGWIYYKNDSFHFTKGLQGFEIYRYSSEEISKNIGNWIKKYIEENGGVSR